MRQILLYSGFLLGGMVASQTLDLAGFHNLISMATMICLACIMIEVGLEFTIDKKHLKRYAWDYVVAAMAASPQNSKMGSGADQTK